MNRQQKIWQQVYQSREKNDALRRQTQRTQKEGRILAIDGKYDHWSEVVPHIRADIVDLVAPMKNLQNLPHPIDSYHVIAIGCPGDENSSEVIESIENYLRAGGTVLTTDWCLGKILTHPGGGWLGSDLVKHLPKGTGSETVPVNICEPSHPLLAGLTTLGTWKLDSASHVADVVDEQKVKVLLRAPQMREKYGSDVILFTTSLGKGTLVHFVSHAYAQPDDMQGAQAAAMILANIFDMAVNSQVDGKEKDVAPPAQGWFRLQTPDGSEILTIRSGDSKEERALNRRNAKLLFPTLADIEGNPFYKYVGHESPILEFEFKAESGWMIRVPGSSRNSFILDGDKIGSEWRSLPMGSRLQLHGHRQEGLVEGLELTVTGE